MYAEHFLGLPPSRGPFGKISLVIVFVAVSLWFGLILYWALAV